MRGDDVTGSVEDDSTAAIRHGRGGVHADNFNFGGSVQFGIDDTSQAEQREDGNTGNNPADGPGGGLVRAALGAIDPQVFEL